MVAVLFLKAHKNEETYYKESYEEVNFLLYAFSIFPIFAKNILQLQSLYIFSPN